MDTRVCLFAALCAFTSVADAEETDSRTIVPLSTPHCAMVLDEARQFFPDCS
jgi:hypothetical protein